MARRRKYTMRKNVKRAKKKNGDSRRKTMLNMGRIESFEWNLGNLLNDLPNPQNRGAIFASIRNKSTNIGIEEAKEYILNKEKEGEIDENTSNELVALLDRFSKRR
ncbi:MAG: hypothetical protein ACE5G7_05790 [Candidatus Hydrothermarchaeaceae archaeon]